jgi:sulfate adenylyltransferase
MNKHINFEEKCLQYPSITLNKKQACDFELLVNGGFDPLTGFLNETDYKSVVEKMRLGNGKLWSMPITLCINGAQKTELQHSNFVVLKHETGLPLGIMDISDSKAIYKPDITKEAVKVYGADDKNHPYVKILYGYLDDGFIYNIGGPIVDFKLPPHYDFKQHRMTPAQTKKYFKENGWNKVVGFQTRNPMHRSHYELTRYAMKMGGEDCKLLLHPVVGITQDCDINYHTRVKCYKALMEYYEKDSALLSLLPLSMRMAGPREAVWHAQIRKNYGCTHFVVGRDHAGPSYKKQDGKDFYGAYDAQDLLMEHAKEIGIQVITSKLIVYALPKGEKDEMKGKYLAIDGVDDDTMDVKTISGTQQREMLAKGQQIPEWFTFPKVSKILKDTFKGTKQKGFCLYFVGLSGCGKSTIANFTIAKLQELTNRTITYLDGDIVRLHLSLGLGFSPKDRSINIRRIGFVSSEVVKHGGVAIAANIAPFENDRLANRDLISENGEYIEIFVNSPISTCEKRDVKGLYKLARDGVIKEFTGISSPFELPSKCELILDGLLPLEQNVDNIVKYLRGKELI